MQYLECSDQIPEDCATFIWGFITLASRTRIPTKIYCTRTVNKNRRKINSTRKTVHWNKTKSFSRNKVRKLQNHMKLYCIFAKRLTRFSFKIYFADLHTKANENKSCSSCKFGIVNISSNRNKKPSKLSGILLAKFSAVQLLLARLECVTLGKNYVKSHYLTESWLNNPSLRWPKTQAAISQVQIMFMYYHHYYFVGIIK